MSSARSARPKSSSATARLWHLRLGHPGPEALNRLINSSTGARIKGPVTVECDDCAVSKITRQVSRVPRQHDEGPGRRLAVDFIHIVEDEEGYNSLMLITDRWSGFIWEFFLSDRKAEMLKTAFEMFLTAFERQYGLQPRIFECDNEITTVKAAVGDMLQSKGILIQPSAPDTQAQNGGAERSGGVIETKARAMRQSAHLPEDLWREIYAAAIYLHNRLPKYTFNWKTPYDRFHTHIAHRSGIAVTDRKPRQGHLRVYGCKAFAMTSIAQRKQQRLHKLNPRAFVGYLVGYQSTNIYRIWNPLLGKVISTRDVIFNEEEVFPGSIEGLKDDFLSIKRSDIATLLESIEEAQTDPQSRDQERADRLFPVFDDDDAYASDGRDADNDYGGETEQDTGTTGTYEGTDAMIVSSEAVRGPMVPGVQDGAYEHMNAMIVSDPEEGDNVVRGPETPRVLDANAGSDPCDQTVFDTETLYPTPEESPLAGLLAKCITDINGNGSRGLGGDTASRRDSGC
jgi:hypothetical protein